MVQSLNGAFIRLTLLLPATRLNDGLLRLAIRMRGVATSLPYYFYHIILKLPLLSMNSQFHCYFALINSMFFKKNLLILFKQVANVLMRMSLKNYSSNVIELMRILDQISHT